MNQLVRNTLLVLFLFIGMSAYPEEAAGTGHSEEGNKELDVTELILDLKPLSF